MVPTKTELVESRQNGELPGEQTQKMGIEADPNELEAGRTDFSINPKKVSAQLKDSRAQRENNLVASPGRSSVSFRPR